MRKILSVVASSIILSACVSNPHRESQPVPAGYLYEAAYINIKVPNSAGWHLVNSSPTGMEFAKSGSEEKESFGAQVLMFPLQETNSDAEFLSLIKLGVEADTDPNRFNIKKLDCNYTEQRDYSCVKVVGELEDKKALTSPGHREPLILQFNSLYCRHPVRTNTGFAIIYSHRGVSSYMNMADEAKDFIDGVQVPNL